MSKPTDNPCGLTEREKHLLSLALLALIENLEGPALAAGLLELPVLARKVGILEEVSRSVASLENYVRNMNTPRG